MTTYSPPTVSDEARLALATAATWVQNGAVVLDTETTGLDSKARLVSLAIVDLQGNVLFNEILNPGILCPPDAIAIHGITNDRLAAARTVQDAWPEIGNILEGKTVLAYNAAFDSRILDQTAAGVKVPSLISPVWGCIMEAFAVYNGEWDDYHGHFRWVKLAEAAKDLAIPTPVVHNALADAQLARQIVLRMAGRYDDLEYGAGRRESLSAGISLLALYRRNLAEVKSVQVAMLQKLHNSPRWQALEMQRAENEKFADMLETQLRTEAGAYFERTGYRDPHQAIEVKNMSKLIYDASKAVDWAIDKFRAALSLDKKLFEKYARSLLGVDPLDFVDVQYTPQAQLSTDLSAYLPKPETTEPVQINLEAIDEIAF